MEEILASIRRIISEDQDEDGDASEDAVAADGDDESPFDDGLDEDIDMAAALEEEAEAAVDAEPAPILDDSDDDDEFEAALAAELEAEGSIEPELDESLDDELEDELEAGPALELEEAGQNLDLGGLENEPDDFDDSVLELTEVVIDEDGDDSGDVDDGPEVPIPAAEAEPEPAPTEPVAAVEPEPEPAPAPEPVAQAPSAPGGVDMGVAVPAAAPVVEAAPSPLANYDLGALVSDEAAAQTSTAFVGFAEQLQQTRGVALGSSARTLEELVKDLLRPMLKEWLDENLPPLVQRLVEREIGKLAGRADEK